MEDMKLIAFDIEIAKPLPEGAADWKAHRPLGISCAVTWASDETKQIVWLDHDDYKLPAPQMDIDECRLLAKYLQDSVYAGYKIVTWNGLSFDIDILHEESGFDCRDLAMNHYDMMFQLFAYRGHYLGLDKAAKGAGLPGKTEGVDGALAPRMWAEGRYRNVIDYCVQDVKTTLDLALWVQENRCMRWISNSGRPNEVAFPDGLMTVQESLALPEPDTSWMSDPVQRSKFTEWMR